MFPTVNRDFEGPPLMADLVDRMLGYVSSWLTYVIGD